VNRKLSRQFWLRRITDPEQLPSIKILFVAAIFLLMISGALVLLPFVTLIHGSNLWREPLSYLAGIVCWSAALMLVVVTATGIVSTSTIKIKERRRALRNQDGTKDD
jgi:hypothetical protein